MVTSAPSSKSIVLIGLMGAGKTSVGRRLGMHFGLPFTDADEEVVLAAGCSIEDIFELYGEKAFREVEKRVIYRIIDGGQQVLATGGGAFMNQEIRGLIKTKCVSVWLRADIDILLNRTARRGGRPLLKSNDPQATLEKLIEERYPVYAEADITIDSANETPAATTMRAAEAITEHLERTGHE